MHVIFRHKPDWGFDNLCEANRTSPFFILDEDLIFPISSTQPEKEFTKEERKMASSEEIDNLWMLWKAIFPFLAVLIRQEQLSAAMAMYL